MSRKVFILLFVVLGIMGSAYAGYYLTAGDKVALTNGGHPPVQRVKKTTSTTALPERTNNAWEMKPFHLVGLDGKTHSLDEWKGKVIMLNFWASWCAPCQYEIKDFVEYQATYGPKGLQIVGLGLDEARKLANVKRTLGINYPVLVADPVNSGDLLAQWGNKKQIVPYTVVIARNGRMKYIHRGQMDDAAFEEYVLPLL